MWPWSYLCEHQCVTKMMERSREWCVSPSLRRRMLYPQQSLTVVVPRWIHTLMMASNVSAERSAMGSRQVSPIPAWYQQRPILSHTNRCNYTFVWGSRSDLFPQFCHPPPTTIRKAVKNNSKWNLTLPCGRTVTSQWQFGGQHRDLHDIGGSENGVLLWTRVGMIKKRQLKQ